MGKGLKAKGRGVGKVLGCKPEEENNAALCYKPCRSGYKGVGPVCWGQCPSGYSDCGALCSPRSVGCTSAVMDIVGKVTKCAANIDATAVGGFTPGVITSCGGAVGSFVKGICR